MVKTKHTLAGLFVALVLVVAPTPAHAQQTTEELIALLEQILQLTQLVLALQAQLEALEAAGVTTNNAPAVVGAPSHTHTAPPSHTAPTQQHGHGYTHTPQQAPVTDIDPNELLTLPVHIHVVESEHEDIQAHTLPADIPSIFVIANSRYWSQANIQWVFRGVQSHAITNNSDTDYVNAVADDDEQLATSQLARFAEGATLQPGFNVFIVHNLGAIPFNGQYFNTGVAVISETNSKEGGEDYIAYLLAHELGHALGLGHEGTFYNLMHPGQKENDVPRNERVVLTDEQIANARAWARTGEPYDGGGY